MVDSRKWMGPARSALTEEAFRLLSLFSGRG